jgi:hypothetical protein
MVGCSETLGPKECFCQSCKYLILNEDCVSCSKNTLRSLNNVENPRILNTENSFNLALLTVWHLGEVVPRPDVPASVTPSVHTASLTFILGYLDLIEPINLL